MSFDLNSAGPATAASAFGAVGTDGGVARSTPCRKCGYDLRGLSAGGNCPECGTPVAFSLQGDLLGNAEPDWLHTLRRGVNCILGGVLAAIAAGILNAIANSSQQPLTAGLGQAVSLLSTALFLIGSWLLTTPDPSGLGDDRYGTSRKLIRIGVICSAAGTLLEFPQAFVNYPPAVATPLALVQLPLGVMAVVAVFATLSYLSKLAQRIPDAALSRRARFLFWALGISYAIVILGAIAVALVVSLSTGSGRPPAGVGAAAGVLGCVVILAVVVFGIMYLLMLERFGKAFKELERVARGRLAGAANR